MVLYTSRPIVWILITLEHKRPAEHKQSSYCDDNGDDYCEDNVGFRFCLVTSHETVNTQNPGKSLFVPKECQYNLTLPDIWKIYWSQGGIKKSIFLLRGDTL